MKKKSKLVNLIEQLDIALRSQQHLTNTPEIEKSLDLISRFAHQLNDEDRDFVLCAKLATSKQVHWSIPP